ncbi:MAG: hypothetical protein NC187_00525 [Candidatus Amulumruptor caecigallinarius]|nr:hypothetical protein [Candidatus Amulumruptor caecigallinarius]MCM1395961.1 hypothetical protein [Candidatus Amulumruptor caecigallinarius]MCM1452996.1 hypothetical protein [bacterium]
METEPEDQCLIDLSARHDVTVVCDVDDAFPYSESLAYIPENSVTSRSEADMMVRRYTVKAFVRGTHQEVASGVSMSPEVSLSLPVGKLDIIGWADYVPQGSVADYYWFTDDFSEMLEHEKAEYRADDDYKAAAHCIENVTVAYNTRRISVGLSTVMAKVRLIASDSPSPEVSRIRVSFPGGVPSAVDAFSGKVCYSWQGVAYNALARPHGSEEWLLSEAMMPANADASRIAICVEMFDADNNIVARIRGIDVPVRRGCITEVKAPFFSAKEVDPVPDDPPSGGGIGIDTDFDDSVVIVLKPA